jgi:metallo-beta-lactamase family protein
LARRSVTHAGAIFLPQSHGEPDAADTLRGRIKREPGWNARVPEHLEQVTLAALQ